MPVCVRCKKEKSPPYMSITEMGGQGDGFWSGMNKGICIECEENLWERRIKRLEKRGSAEDPTISDRLQVGFWLLNEDGGFGDSKQIDLFEDEYVETDRSNRLSKDYIRRNEIKQRIRKSRNTSVLKKTDEQGVKKTTLTSIDDCPDDPTRVFTGSENKRFFNWMYKITASFINAQITTLPFSTIEFKKLFLENKTPEYVFREGIKNIEEETKTKDIACGDGKDDL